MRIFLAAYALLLATLVALAAVGGAVVLGRSGPDDAIAALADRYAYNVPRWEVRHLLGKLLYSLGHLFDGGLSPQEEDALLGRYFQLTEEIAALERAAGQEGEPGSRERLATLRQARRDSENRVEAILEGRLDDLFQEQGLTISPPLFADIDIVFPPVDFEFDNPPRVLAISPRHRIHLDRSYLLAHGLSLEEITAIEAEAEASGVSAIVVLTGGAATYPSVIPELSELSTTVETAIHEWLHQYLALHPLGRHFFSNNELRTLNETVANMAAAELAQILLGPKPAEAAAPPTTEGFDFGKEMRALRLQVEDLLSAGKIEEAERLMEERRKLFAEKGYYIRRINQAYFAWQGSYADTPASIDPIGPRLEALRQRLGSVGEFVRIAAQFTSVEDLDRALAELGVTLPGSSSGGPGPAAAPVPRPPR